MKRHKQLWEQVVSFDNLLLASQKARRGKRKKRETAHFEFRLESELCRLREELISGAYRPGEYRTFTICEPKTRLISAAPYRDRVVHHALCNVIEPIFERSFIFDSYACRKGKGVHRAVDRFQRYCRSNAYVLKFDLQKFFPSIDHKILKALVARKIGDRRVLQLINVILDNSNPQVENVAYFAGDHLFTPHQRRRGLPIGNLTSQFFGNVYLNGLDHFIKEELRMECYVRYVDDLVILHDDKSWLWNVCEAVSDYLSGLRLKMHPRKCWIFRPRDGVDFLGYQVFPDYRRLRRASGVRFARRLKRLQWDYKAGRIDVRDVQQSLAGWFGHASHADTWRLKRSLLHNAVFCRS